MFRTPIGFHDAYVAAPSQKAALEAWGTDTNLFARGAAEVVTDPQLTRAPLERPGEVVRVLRGSEAEQIRALGAAKKKSKDRPTPGPSRAREGRSKKRKAGPRPSSAGVDRAEKALAEAQAKHRDALAELKAEAEALDKRRRALERKQREERERLGVKLDEAREKYRAAMEEWAG
ncbi:hypothetical protein [Sphingomonas sp.]|uniref:hypothetical protein n=1 Tax=Sphingomonas sp. TaxID=28214 RepID=UPI0018587905|nr:hypothetical protein [Sphingomonas sp.]MBA3512425.1 hypothetical protein [Sphingomonas sp.]